MGTILIVCLFYICWKVRKIDKKLNGSKSLVNRLAAKIAKGNEDEKEEKGTA